MMVGMVWLEKMIQIIFRLRDLGIESPEITNELIDELHKVVGMREESVANLQGTCVPEYSRLGACPNSRCSILSESDSTLDYEQVFSALEYRSDTAAAAECAGLRAERPCLAVYR